MLHAMGNSPSSHCLEGWVGLGAGLDNSRDVCPSRVSTMNQPAHGELPY